ncbi:MAG: HAD family hydrolase [Candidatus Dormibacterales bacterium]
MRILLEVALVDVGGTLWPNSWPLREIDGEGRRRRVSDAMPELGPDAVDALVADLISRSRIGESTESETVPPADEVVAVALRRSGLPVEARAVMRIRRAMALPVADRLEPLAGAVELLATIHDLGLRTVIASNTYWRDAETYWDDFRQLGMADHVDAIVTSVDAGHLKPHPAVFQKALRWANVSPAACVMIGNSEEKDVEPAITAGMHAILVYPDDPEPLSSRAHATARDLWSCAAALKAMLRG